MGTLRLCLAFLALALPFAICARAQAPPTYPVTISVRDISGAGVAHAPVHITPAAPALPANMETDQAGEVHLQLPARVYKISVSVAGFKIAEQLVRVTDMPEAKVPAQTIRIILDIGPMGNPTVYPEGSLVIDGGLPNKTMAYSAATFSALPHVSLTVHNAHSNADETYSGVPLATLLAKVGAPLGSDLHGAAMSHHVLATGSDGYTVALSLAEVDPSFHAGQVIVADARDGKPLGDRGPFQLIVSDDKRPARWVHNLNAIELSNAR